MRLQLNVNKLWLSNENSRWLLEIWVQKTMNALAQENHKVSKVDFYYISIFSLATKDFSQDEINIWIFQIK